MTVNSVNLLISSLMHQQRGYCITKLPPVAQNRFLESSSGAMAGVGCCCTFVAPGFPNLDESAVTVK